MSQSNIDKRANPHSPITGPANSVHYPVQVARDDPWSPPGYLALRRIPNKGPDFREAIISSQSEHK